MSDDVHLRVLHALRLKGLADAAAVAEHASIAVERSAEVLGELDAAGLVRHRDRGLTGYALTADGRARGEQLLMAELEAHGLVERFGAIYGSFHELNRRFLTLCSEWQTRADPTGNVVLNDHTDAVYDAGVLDRLRSVHGEITAIANELAAGLTRFARYTARFAAAMGRIDQGETEWFTKPLIDSYHTVWFELHEDLLATLNLERSKEITA